EDETVKPADPDATQWPKEGKIEIKDLELRYPNRPDSVIIKGISALIKPGEKVGVVGRTGSGKSTLLTAFFRIMEPSQGTITIDGQDIQKLGLATLRSRIQIISQEPVLFDGTFRSNLDHTGEHTDDELWKALEYSGLKDYVSELPEKLDASITTNGENLSVGQRQLKSIFSQMTDASGQANAQLIRELAQQHYESTH
ncbi:hypothetical protein HK103_003021, partial [Boothiomyces macroporosus]